jgi:phenylpropionate dioxygenase-like ring-hydroxylating dioxygenase large terminal subunit
MANQIGAEQLVDGCRVNRRVYTEREIFELEMDRIFARTWVFLCHESEVAAPGEFRTLQIGTQPAIVTRDERDEVQVLMNHCMHRGATLCQDRRGQANALRCWYHGWTYNLRGELIGVPYAQGYGPDFDRSRRSMLKPARVQKYRGLVFASLAAEGPDLVDYLAGAKRYLDFFMNLSPLGEIEARAGGHKFTYQGNWKFQLENGVDGYHPNFVHRSFFAMQPEGATAMFNDASPGLTRALGNGHSILDMSPLVKPPAGNGDRPPTNPLPTDGLKPATTGDYFDQLVRAWGRDRALEILEQSNVNLAIFPNLLIIGVQLRTVTPVSVTETEVYQQPTTLKGVSDEMNAARLRAHEAFYGPAALGAPDDLEMFSRCSLGMRVRGHEWITFDRGLQRERFENGERLGHITDEVPQRAFYRQWHDLMAAGFDQSADAGGNGHARAALEPPAR